MPSLVPRISRLAASRICVCLPMTSGCPLPDRKFRPLWTLISSRHPLSVLHCRRRNPLLILRVMFVSLHVSCPLSRVPFPYHRSRVSLPCHCHSRSHRLLTSFSLAFLEPIENSSYLHISRQFGRKLEFSFRLRVAQSRREQYLRLVEQ